MDVLLLRDLVWRGLCIVYTEEGKTGEVSNGRLLLHDDTLR